MIPNHSANNANPVNISKPAKTVVAYQAKPETWVSNNINSLSNASQRKLDERVDREMANILESIDGSRRVSEFCRGLHRILKPVPKNKKSPNL
jgi:hypothetical protein